MANSNRQKFTGLLTLEELTNYVILKTDGGDLYPLPNMMYEAISVDAMKAAARVHYADNLGQTVTIEGYGDGHIIWGACIIRTFEPRDENSPYGRDYWNNRVPKADITWLSRRIPVLDDYPNTYTLAEADVRQFITPNDCVIRGDLENHALMVENPDQCNEDMYRIYLHSRTKDINPYYYEYDDLTFGCEYFMYPYELRTLRKGDCDDWGIELASYLICAGVPEWRVRCVVGDTYGGGGHLTVYVLADDLTNWYHLNSTTPMWVIDWYQWSKLTDFPKANDSYDYYGIEHVWFSFNNVYAWNSFESHASIEKARRTPWMRNFRIKPRFD
jgi:hypothetical protein